MEACEELDFDTIYKNCYSATLGRVRVRVPVNDAEDVAQDVYVAVFKNLHKFKRKSKFSTWLQRIEMNKIADYYRKAFRKERRVEFAGGKTTVFVDRRKGVLTDLMVQQTLHSLLPTHREVLILRFMEGMNFSDMAEYLGLTYECVRSRHRRALKSAAIILAEGN